MAKLSLDTYDIHINDWTALNELISTRSYSSIVVIVDENTTAHCLPTFVFNFEHKFDIIEIESGESNKSLETCHGIWSTMMDFGIDRHSLCINLGGGVIGDMGGFCAATFMRGMDFVHIPTTLLSMVDASVGGKLGIDFDNYKNLIGVICDPQGVFIFTDFIETLPTREVRSGFAEVIKHGLIADKDAYDRDIEIDLETFTDWEALVAHSVGIKKHVVMQDSTEKSIRKVLNFGHTIGHAIESINLDTGHHLLHGEAIAIGMIIEVYMSHQLGYLSLEDAELIKNHFTRIYGHHPESIPPLEDIQAAMKHDKKNIGGKVLFSLLANIGEGNYNQEVSEEIVKKSVEWYM